MQTRIVFLILSIFALVSPALKADFNSSRDVHSCWDATKGESEDCVSLDIAWKKENELDIFYSNTCQRRIVIKMCHEEKSGDWDCGTTGLKPNAQKLWRSYQPTGKYKWIAIGSVHSQNDAICVDKAIGWEDVP